MEPVIQEEASGCGIACAAAIAGITYNAAKKVANSIGIYANDESLWSETKSVRHLLNKLGYKLALNEVPFRGWESLPNCALLSIKWHKENQKSYWHWVVFVRDSDSYYVLDSKKELKNNIRTDFGRMKPKWYIEII